MRTLFLILILLHINDLVAQSSGNGLVISKLTEDTYVFTTYKKLGSYMFPSNGLYIVTSKGVVLLDTPWDTLQCQPLLDSISKRHQKEVVLVVSTHYHDDRTAGLDFLKRKGVKTYSSKQTFDLCKEHHEKQPGFYFVKDTLFTIGQYQFETYYPGEGHTKDNIVIWIAKEKILYGGCLVKSCENKGLGNIADANLEEWGLSVEKVMRKYPQPKYIVPGHFEWTCADALSHTLKLLELSKKK